MPEPPDRPRPPGKVPMPYQMLYGLLSVVFPSSCALCGGALEQGLWGGACADCWNALESWSGPACSRCGLPLTGSVETEGYLCGGCRLDEPHFDFARTYGVYSN